MSKTHTISATTTIGAAMPKEIVVNHGSTYFDPIDMIEDYTSVHPAFYSRILASMAWRIDSMCIQAARSVFFTRYSDPEREDQIGFTDFCLTVGAELQHASLYEYEGPEQTLAQLLAVRNTWHEAAARASALNDKDYRAKSLRELLEAEKVSPPSVETRTNYAEMAKQESGGDPAVEARLYAAYLEADQMSSGNRVERNKPLVAPILEILRAASQFAYDEIRFDQLPRSSQRILTTYAAKCVTRMRSEMAKVTAPISFGHLNECAIKCTKAIERVIADKFSEQDTLENAGLSQIELDHQRGQKRRACSID